MITIKIHNPEYNRSGIDWIIQDIDDDDEIFNKLLLKNKSEFIIGKFTGICSGYSSTVSDDYSIKYKKDNGPWITVYDTEIIKGKVEIEW